MEIIIDIGADIVETINYLSNKKGKSKEVMAAEIMSVGSQVLLNSLEEKQDKVTATLLKNSIRANEILIEILSSVFNKEKSKPGVYDADTALAIIDRIVDGYTND